MGQKRNPQDRRQRHQAAEGEHRRVQAFLRDHGRRRPGFPQGEDHGQHPQVLLMIAFTAYMREMAEAARGGDGEKLPGGKSAIPGNQLKLGKTFVTFMDAQPELRGLIDSGKGNLQWERDIPAAALANLEGLANSDFKANLGKIIHDIYQTAHQMFSDMPQGDHKKRAKYRFASKTLMRILPSS